MSKSQTKHCSLTECESEGYAKGYCRIHYYRVCKYGDPHYNALTAKSENWLERFWSKVNKTETCWLWTEGVTEDGYAQFWRKGKNVRSHRVAWELERGSVPQGLELDHTCHVRHCVYVPHMRLATSKQQKENKVGAQIGSTSKFRGVSFSKSSNKWVAYVCHNYNNEYLGSYDTEEQANHAAEARRNELYTHNDLDRK